MRSRKKIIFLALLILLSLAAFLSANFLKNQYFQAIRSKDSRVNFLLLGVNDYAAGEDLTDSIMFVSLNSQQGKTVLLSLPRDLWIEEIKAKINTAYHYGGIDLARETVGKILGQQIDCVAVVDFIGFEKVIDLLEGIEVEVRRGFDDFKYPIAGREKDLCDGDPKFACRYEHLFFEAGWQAMDGKTALKFARSRNAEGEEGTDFSRNLRQQQIIQAMRKKIMENLSLVIWRMPQFWQAFKETVKTDLPQQQYGSILWWLAKARPDQAKFAVLPEGLLINPRRHYSKQWVLLPSIGNWQEIQGYVRKALE